MPGAQDYDLTLRCLSADARFEHVAHVLYHWRVHPGSTADGSADSKPYAIEAGRLALQRHFNALGICGTVEDTETPFVYRMRYALPEPAPLVSIVIPTKDHIETLDACVMSIAQKATYANYEIVLVENNSEAPETFAYYETLPERVAAASEGKGIARVVYWPGEFNYSQIINFGVEHAKGDYLLLLNNDTEVISPDFIEEMMGYLQRSEAGVVGAKLYFADHLVQHAGIVVGVRGALAHANQDFSAKREGYLARAVRPGNFCAVTVPARWSDATYLSGSAATTRNSPLALTTQTFACAHGRRATAPSLRPMPSCTTTSSPRAAEKRPTRKRCVAGNVNRHCSCSAGRSSS